MDATTVRPIPGDHKVVKIIRPPTSGLRTGISFDVIDLDGEAAVDVHERHELSENSFEV
jgi:hypothetical protein